MEIIRTQNKSDHKLRILSCGHTSKLIERSIVESIGTRYIPSPGEKIIANVSGAHDLSISGDVKSVEIQKSENKPPVVSIQYNHFEIKAPVNSPTTTISNQSSFQNITIQNIMNVLNQQVNLNVDQRKMVEEKIKEFEQESMKKNPDSGKLKSILNQVCPIAKSALCFSNML